MLFKTYNFIFKRKRNNNDGREKIKRIIEQAEQIRQI